MPRADLKRHAMCPTRQRPICTNNGESRRVAWSCERTGFACRALAGKDMRCARSVEGVDLYKRWSMAPGRPEPREAVSCVQAYCKNLPSDHGQLAGIIKLNPRRRGDSLFYKPQMRRGLASAQHAVPTPASTAPRAREGIKTPSLASTRSAGECSRISEPARVVAACRSGAYRWADVRASGASGRVQPIRFRPCHAQRDPCYEARFNAGARCSTGTTTRSGKVPRARLGSAAAGGGGVAGRFWRINDGLKLRAMRSDRRGSVAAKAAR
jgi:hypothetical protein